MTPIAVQKLLLIEDNAGDARLLAHHLGERAREGRDRLIANVIRRCRHGLPSVQALNRDPHAQQQ